MISTSTQTLPAASPEPLLLARNSTSNQPLPSSPASSPANTGRD
ncbi:hypothetical protein HanPSC8_Chr12g0541751 [Helianthus annuus]|nr:hypothetical protein HanPSC8_Chr12g0541751 [Helianthus annuus]